MFPSTKVYFSIFTGFIIGLFYFFDNLIFYYFSYIIIHTFGICLSFQFITLFFFYIHLFAFFIHILHIMDINLQNIHKYVQKHQGELASMKAYFNKYEENSINQAKKIVEINEQIKKSFKIITDKSALKTMKEFSQNIEEKESNQKIVQFIRFRVKNWFQVCESILNDVKEKLRAFDLKHQRKQLTESDSKEFKNYLIKSISSYQQNKEAIIAQFANLQISCNARLLQSLTNRIQKLRNN